MLTGESVCTYCPQWKAECLKRDQSARVVLGIGSVARRRAWIDDYGAQFGPEAQRRLETVVRSLWAARGE